MTEIVILKLSCFNYIYVKKKRTTSDFIFPNCFACLPIATTITTITVQMIINDLSNNVSNLVALKK